MLKKLENLEKVGNKMKLYFVLQITMRFDQRPV